MKKKLVLGAHLAGVSIVLSLVSIPLLVMSSLFTTGKIFPELQGGLFILFVTTPVMILTGMYGKKNASAEPRTTGWIMFMIGILGSLSGQPLSGVVLIIAGVHTILTRK